MSEHFLLNGSKLNFTIANPKPSDRSIFRKNIGRAVFNKNNDYYLKIWNIDYTSKEIRLKSMNFDILYESIDRFMTYSIGL